MLEVGEHRAVSPSGHRNPPLINSVLSYFPHIWQLLEWVQRHCISSTARTHSTCWAVSEGKSISWHLFWIHCSSPPPPLRFTLHSSPASSPHHHLSLSDQDSPVRAEDLNGELMTHTCSSPVPPPANFLCLLLTQEFALSNLTLTQEIICASTLSHVQVFPTRTKGSSIR